MAAGGARVEIEEGRRLVVLGAEAPVLRREGAELALTPREDREAELDLAVLAAAGAARWTLDELYLPEHGHFAYHRGSDALIHNASLLGARLVHELVDDAAARDAVTRAVELTIAAQRADGSWPYGEGIAFTDSFHTGFVLDCLCALRDVDPAVGDAVARGAAFYAERFFHDDGWASLWPDRRYPLDAHSAGTGLTSLAALVRTGHADADLLRRVAERTVSGVVRRGHAVHRRYRWRRTTVRYVRWCDAHVALGLADAAETLTGSPAAAKSSVDASRG